MYHILVVEDDQDINRLLCRILTDGGYDVRPAFSGSEAVLWAEQYDYDLVLLDLMLPGLTGEEFIAQMRKKKTMPILVLSAGKEVPLTAREFDILALLMSHPKKVYTREQLYENVWGGEYFGDDNTVNVHISNLRSKLAKASDREYIKTVWGIGFKMNDQQETL